MIWFGADNVDKWLEQGGAKVHPRKFSLRWQVEQILFCNKYFLLMKNKMILFKNSKNYYGKQTNLTFIMINKCQWHIIQSINVYGMTSKSYFVYNFKKYHYSRSYLKKSKIWLWQVPQFLVSSCHVNQDEPFILSHVGNLLRSKIFFSLLLLYFNTRSKLLNFSLNSGQVIWPS